MAVYPMPVVRGANMHPTASRLRERSGRQSIRRLCLLPPFRRKLAPDSFSQPGADRRPFKGHRPGVAQSPQWTDMLTREYWDRLHNSPQGSDFFLRRPRRSDFRAQSVHPRVALPTHAV